MNTPLFLHLDYIAEHMDKPTLMLAEAYRELGMTWKDAVDTTIKELNLPLKATTDNWYKLEKPCEEITWN